MLDSNSKSETKEHGRDDILALAGLTFPINTTAVSGTTFKEKSHNAWSSGAVLKSCTRSRLLCKSPSALGLDRRTTLPSAETRPAQRHRSKFVASKQSPSTKLEHSVQYCSMGPTPWFCETQHPSTLEVKMKPKKKSNQEMGVSKNRGTPKWMVYNGKPY